MTTIVKTCFKCGDTKAISEFYKHSEMADGHLGKCKACTKADVKSNYATKRQQYSDYDAKRRQNPVRKQQQAANLTRHRKRHPDRDRARAAVSRAIRSGRLIRQPCPCGNPKSQAHHSDYSRPLDVSWLCFKCHREKEHGQTVVRVGESPIPHTHAPSEAA